MKRIRKIASVLLTVAMLAAMVCQTAFADEPTYTISVLDGEEHSYEVYQIFTGTASGEGATTKLADVKWGKNAKFPEGSSEGTAVSEEVINALTAVNSSSETEKLAEISKYVDFESKALGTVSKDSSLNVVSGYYLIKDLGKGENTESYSIYLVEVVAKDVQITPKKDQPPFYKSVKDVNDSTGDKTDWQDSADYDIGDDVPFQLGTTLPDNFDVYKEYKLVFHDTLSEGLTFNNDVKVYVDGTEIDSSKYTVETPTGDNCSFHVTVTDLKTVNAAAKGKIVTVEYTAKLNDNAVIGASGNKNEAQLEYSNNPNNTADTGKTVEDSAIVFTYEFVVNKVDESRNPLAGAEFTLYKKVNGAEDKQLTFTVSAEKTTFTLTGLDDGDYVLKETKAPTGYNKIADIEFTITAEHENETLNSLTVNNSSFTPDTTAGKITTDIENKSGSSLPTTGGIGTTILYVVGGILIVAAGVALITKKRVQNEK